MTNQITFTDEEKRRIAEKVGNKPHYHNFLNDNDVTWPEPTYADIHKYREAVNKEGKWIIVLQMDHVEIFMARKYMETLKRFRHSDDNDSEVESLSSAIKYILSKE